MFHADEVRLCWLFGGMMEVYYFGVLHLDREVERGVVVKEVILSWGFRDEEGPLLRYDFLLIHRFLPVKGPNQTGFACASRLRG